MITYRTRPDIGDLAMDCRDGVTVYTLNGESITKERFIELEDEIAAFTSYPYEVTCYGDPAGRWGCLEEALSRAELHIGACPQGAMPWATPVEWHATVTAAGEIWVSAARGEWLDHTVRRLGSERSELPSEPARSVPNEPASEPDQEGHE